jgi:hypothetical protein
MGEGSVRPKRSTRYRIRNLTGRCGHQGADTGYPQEALEDIFLYWDRIEKKSSVRDTTSMELSQE